MIQGIIFSFYLGTLPVFLIEKGALLSDIAIIHLSALPFSFKLIFAPFLDIYYSNSFGKRKSYIVPANYFLSFILIGLSFDIEDLIASQQLKFLTFFGILSIFLLAIQDIAADGMGADIFIGEKSIYASLAQTIGISLGTLISSHVLVQLNSKTFCNRFFYFEEKNEGILKISHFLCFLGVSLFLVNLYIHKFLNEAKVSQEKERISLKESILSMKAFFLNPSLICFLCFLIISRFTFCFLDSSFKLQLIQKGFPKEDFSNIFLLMLFAGIFFQTLLPKFLKKTSEIKLFYFVTFCKLLENVISLILIETYSNEYHNSYIFWCFLILVCATSHLHHNISYGIMASFYNRISHTFFSGFEATSIAFLTSFGNFGKRMTDVLSLSIIEKFDFKVLVVTGWLMGGGFLLFVRQKILDLENRMSKEIDKRKAD